MRNQILCGESSQVMATWPDDCVDLVVTSPPYDGLRTYNGYKFPFEAIAQQLYRVAKPGGVVKVVPEASKRTNVWQRDQPEILRGYRMGSSGQ